MTAGMIYLICVCSVVMSVGIGYALYVWGDDGWSEVVPILVLSAIAVAMVVGALPGAIWDKRITDSREVTEMAETYSNGDVLQEGIIWRGGVGRVVWADDDSLVHTTLVFDNPWGEEAGAVIVVEENRDGSYELRGEE